MASAVANSFLTEYDKGQHCLLSGGTVIKSSPANMATDGILWCQVVMDTIIWQPIIL